MGGTAPAAVALGLLALTVLGVALVPPASAADSQVSIESVAVSPAPAAPGEPFTATLTIRNAASSDTPARITQVGLRGDDVLTTQNDIGTLGTGDTLEVPISATIDGTGQHRLTAFVHGQDVGSQQSFYVQYPVYVTVEEPSADVALSVTAPEAVAGQEVPVNVTVANGDADPIAALTLTLDGDTLSARDPRRVSPNLAAGAERTFSFDVRFAEPGPRAVRASLDYRTAEGYARTNTETATVDVEALRVDGDLSARVEQNGSHRNVLATLENFGNVALEEVVVRVERDGDRLDRVQGPDVPVGETRTVAINADDFPAGDLDVVATYEAADETETTSTRLDFAPAVESRIELSGLDVSGAAGRVTISGDAANVGAVDAEAVVLAVVPTDGVTPVNPNREYFVGTIESSEFATFELTASVAPGTTEVPVEVRYTVDGGRRSRIVPVDVGDASMTTRAGSGGPPGGGSTLLLAGAAVLALAVVGAYLWRRRR